MNIQHNKYYLYGSRGNHGMLIVLEDGLYAYKWCRYKNWKYSELNKKTLSFWKAGNIRDTREYINIEI